MIPTKSAPRQAALKARRLAAGLVLVSVWVHADDAQRVRALAEKLARERAKEKP